MATRIFELAKQIGVTSKTILEKCRAEGLDIKNHMHVLSAGLEATIREWFAEGAVSTAVETSQHVDIEQARAQAKRQRRKKKEGEEGHAGEGEAVAVAEGEVEAVPAEVAEKEAPAEAAPVAEAVPAAAEPLPAEQAEVVPSQGVAAPAPVVEVPPAVAATAAHTAAPEAAAPAPAAVQPPPAAAAPASGQQAAAKPAAGKESKDQKPPEKAVVKPAGPQLVPRPAKLQGPRVVRVEKPDIIAPPRRRPQGGPGAGPGGPAQSMPTVGGIKRPKKPLTPAEEEEEAKAAAAGKKRSPRRRGGRSADSGEVLKEWRNQDLVERAARLASAAGGLRRHRLGGGKGPDGSPAASSKPAEVEVEEPITIKALSAASGLKAGELMKRLIGMGTLATINQVLPRESAEMLLLEFGIELKIHRAKSAEELMAEELALRPKADLVNRAPVVTFLGHVDHGKTSLLDRIRNQTVAAGEAGGITQHIGAYRCDVGNSHVVFLDTPGHEAFTAMRARGANMTDVVVLVVAADDGVMPQTVEALSHAKAAKVPIIVALNKIDLPNANETRVLGQLAENGLNPREWGGNVEVIRTSASTGQGVDTLVETLSLEAELLELKAEVDAPASGYVIESTMSAGLGAVARMLVLNGTLKVGDIIQAGAGYGRVRQMLDHRGKPITEAPPSTPVEVSGLDEIPEAGDKFYVADDLDQARSVAEDRRQRTRTAGLAAVPQRSLEALLGRIEAGKASQLALIIKADVQGSIEAITGSIKKLNTDEVRVNILHAGVGGITTGDVSLAEASDAIIIGFNAVPDSSAKQMAEAKGVDIRQYRIIYDILEDIRKALEEGLAPEVRLETLGRAEVRQVFKVSRVGTVAGCIVLDGVVNRSSKVRITRSNIVIEDERTLESLKRFKEDVRDVRAGMECGLKVAGYDDIKEGDILEFYHKVSVARKL